MSKTCIYCHIVFGTKYRLNKIPMDKRYLLYGYIKSIITTNKCTLIKAGGISDHVHLLIDLHPDIALAPLVKSIKQSTSIWMRGNPDFSQFDKWQSGYFAGSLGPDGVERCKHYIENQETHHLHKNMLEEMEWLISKYGLQWYEEDWV